MNKDFQETVKKARRFSLSNSLSTVFTNEQVKDLRVTINAMERDISKAMAGEKVEFQEKDAKATAFMLERLLTYFLTDVVREEVKEFALAYLRLAFNYTKLQKEMACRRPPLEQAVQKLNSFVNYHESVVATTQVLKVLLKRAREMKQFSPPAFELSRAYIKTLEEGDERGNS